jgi:hypothetical protein
MPFYGISENGANIQLDQYGYSAIAGKRLPGNGQTQHGHRRHHPRLRHGPAMKLNQYQMAA